MRTRTILITLFALCSAFLNVWFLAELRSTHIRPRTGKDCSVEMKNLMDDSWSPVILVHGYVDNYSVAKFLVDMTEKDETASGGRPKGSFRVKIY